MNYVPLIYLYMFRIVVIEENALNIMQAKVSENNYHVIPSQSGTKYIRCLLISDL